MITPKFTTENLKSNLATSKEIIRQQIKSELIAAGDFFFDVRNLNRTYKDDTGDLISSTGYGIGEDGVMIAQRFEGTENGIIAGIELAESLIQGKSGLSFVLVAGMKYALPVESKGYDVMTESQIQTLKKLIEDFARITKLR